jgi:hypothetical protein
MLPEFEKKTFENTGEQRKWVISTGNLDNLVIEKLALYCGFQMAHSLDIP